MKTETDTSDLYNSKMAIPDSVFDVDTDLTHIPGFKEGRLPPCIKAICSKYASVFTKPLIADKRIKFEPTTLPLNKGVKPTRRTKTCQKTPLHWKRTMDKMITALLKSEMIEQVKEGTGEYLFEAFLVPKP